jgi:hypothetical protein
MRSVPKALRLVLIMLALQACGTNPIYNLY